MIYWQTSDSKTKSSPSPGVVAAQIQSHSPAPRRCLSIQKPPGTLPRCQTHQPGNFMDHLSVSSQQKYSHTMFVQRFTINYFSLSKNHIKKLTEKHITFFFKTFFLKENLQRRVLLQNSVLLCLGHVLAGDAHALRPAAWAEARLLQALRHLKFHEISIYPSELCVCILQYIL